jgi:PAT family beta-lactamase induction signal transducer AmpG
MVISFINCKFSIKVPIITVFLLVCAINSRAFVTTKFSTEAKDSIKKDTIRIKKDSLKTKTSPNGIDAEIKYNAKDSIIFDVENKMAYLYGSAHITYQDIALDAFRIESADTKLQGVLAASYQTGYRFAMIWAGAGALWIAARAQESEANVYDAKGWQIAYLCMAASMLVGLITVLCSKESQFIEKQQQHTFSAWMKVAFLNPFADFIQRYQWQAVLILSLIAVYRISDVVMGIMANPFYVDMGYTKDEVASVTKVFGVIMTLVGAFIGGGLTVRFGIIRILMIGAILSAGSNILFSWLATRGHDLTGLIFVISADNLSSGIASAAFIAYLSSLTNISYSATQYALFSSMMLLIPKWLAGFSGVFVDHFGYQIFFISTAVIGLPVLILVWLVGRQAKTNEDHHNEKSFN